MAEDATVSPREIKKIAERALVLQSYLLRRAWGVLYATLSLAIFVTVFVSPKGLSSESTIVLKFVVDMVASLTAIIATTRALKRARDTAEIRNAMVDMRWSKPLGYRVIVPAWVAIYAVLILTVIFFRPQAVSVILLVYAALAAYLYYALRLSFPLKLPPEGIVALSSLAIATTGSLALLSFLVGNQAPYVILWSSTVAVWLLAGAYARTRKQPGSLEDSAA